MKRNNIAHIVGCLTLLFIAIFINWKFEVIVFHPFRNKGLPELKVMTWNVHCSNGADSVRQRKIAELIIDVDADFVQLNEYHQKHCLVMDSLLKTRYPYTEECQSHQRCGNIFYSKRMMFHSGYLIMPRQKGVIRPIKATIALGNDSVQIIGAHFASNHYDESSFEKEHESDITSYDRYKDAQEQRCIQAYWIKAAVLELKLPVIVMGDMNDFNCSAPLDTLTSCGLKDSWWEGGNGYGSTFHDRWMRLRIDHILHSKELILEGIKVMETDLSDHNPVVAGFSLNANTRSSSARLLPEGRKNSTN